MKKDKQILLSVIGIVVLLIAIIGITYSFFNYTRTGTGNTIRVGRISFITRQTETINLSNIFPIDVTNGIPNDDSKVGTFELEITGDTDYSEGIEYLISVVNTHITTSTGQIIPIGINVTVEGLGTPNSNYFTARESKNANIYKRLSGNGIMGDQDLLVGYIKPNTTAGTTEGVNGTITIKAYLDANKIAITDTYDGSESETNGTTNEWVGDRFTVTTTEWNAIQNNGISFQVKVEANEGIWVDEPLYDIIERNSVIDNQNNPSKFINNTTPGIDFSQISSDTNGNGVYTRAGTENDAYPIMYYRGAVDNNNVLFANKCWKMVRTTDTGGVKLIYNGENKGTEETPNCDNTGTDTQITLNIDGTETNKFAFNDYSNSPAYNGYMYGTVYSVTNGDYEVGSKFGNGVTWNGTNYTLTNVNDTLDENHHYTCGTKDAINCSEIRYYFVSNNYSYFTLSDGKSIDEALVEMQQNITSSNAKNKVEEWYSINIDSASASKIEDTIYCNDKSISLLGGMNPNGELESLRYSGFTRASQYNPSLSCQKNYSFTKTNKRGNNALEYPVGLINADEIMLAGGRITQANSNIYLNSGELFFSMSPVNFDGVNARMFRINKSGNLGNIAVNSSSAGLRPVLSLKNGTIIVDNDADGTVSKPYIIK